MTQPILPRFIQIHALTSYPNVLLNRDDAGLAKRMTVGGAVRTRISSQCLKRHWRTSTAPGAIESLSLPTTTRSRRIFQDLIVDVLVAEGLNAKAVVEATIAVRDLVLGAKKEPAKKEKEKEKKEKKPDATASLPLVETSQLVVLGDPEIQYLRQLVRDIVLNTGNVKLDDKKVKDNLRALKMASGASGAMFGRMVTSDILSRCDAAVHVAHAFTVHKEEVETDYFTALDDLNIADATLGSAHIGHTELTSGLYYTYVTVDVGLLVSNLEGVAQTNWQSASSVNAAHLVRSLIQSIATVSPGAKLGATAPHAYASTLFVEAGSAQPFSWANAFFHPVSIKGDGVLANTHTTLASFLRAMDRVYAPQCHRRFVTVENTTCFHQTFAGEEVNLSSLLDWVETVVADKQVV